jgi:hypothetical protein
MTDPPIACSLTPADLRTRQADTAALARRSLRSGCRVSRGERLVFAADAGTESALREVIAAEQRCCAFLSLDLRRAGDSLELTITGPEEAKPIIAELFA